MTGAIAAQNANECKQADIAAQCQLPQMVTASRNALLKGSVATICRQAAHVLQQEVWQHCKRSSMPLLQASNAAAALNGRQGEPGPSQYDKAAVNESS